MHELISVIVPIFNQEKYIDKCISSLLNQTYGNYEIILINDGSTDSSSNICKKYEEKKNVILLEQANKGVSVARNEGLIHSSGKWIAFVDPDDYVEPNYLEKLMEYVDDEIDIVISGCTVFDENYKYKESFYSENFDVSSMVEKKVLYKQLLDVAYGQPGKVYTACGVPWGKLYRHEFLRKNSLFFEPKLLRMQDNVFNMQAFILANKIRYVNLFLYNYRLAHVVDYVDNFNPRLGDFLFELRKARYAFFNTYYDNDVDIRKYYSEEAYNQIKWYFNGYLYHVKNDMNQHERMMLVKKLLEQKEFDECISLIKYKNIQRKKEKLYLFALRNRICWLIDYLARNERWIIQ